MSLRKILNCRQIANALTEAGFVTLSRHMFILLFRVNRRTAASPRRHQT
jgi:hypothetical protein